MLTKYWEENDYVDIIVDYFSGYNYGAASI